MFHKVLSLFVQFYKTARECLALAEIGDCLQCSPDPRSDATLLGVTQEDINRHHPHKKVPVNLDVCQVIETNPRIPFCTFSKG